MRFYYISIFSVMLLGLFYLIGTGLLAALWLWLRKRWKKAWIAMVPLFLLLYAAPVAEEFWIAWNFGQLCKKDAGIFIYKTVEADGFYDDTRPAHAGPPTPLAVKSMNESGYRFHERPLRDNKGGPTKVVRIEKVDGQWTSTVPRPPRGKVLLPVAAYEYPRRIQGREDGAACGGQSGR